MYEWILLIVDKRSSSDHPLATLKNSSQFHGLGYKFPSSTVSLYRIKCKADNKIGKKLPIIPNRVPILKGASFGYTYAYTE